MGYERHRLRLLRVPYPNGHALGVHEYAGVNGHALVDACSRWWAPFGRPSRAGAGRCFSFVLCCRLRALVPCSGTGLCRGDLGPRLGLRG